MPKSSQVKMVFLMFGIHYAPNFEKVEVAYRFGLVCACLCVRPYS